MITDPKKIEEALKEAQGYYWVRGLYYTDWEPVKVVKNPCGEMRVLVLFDDQSYPISTIAALGPKLEAPKEPK